jgi:hypothetical protein
MVFHTWPSVFKDEIATGANYIAFAFRRLPMLECLISLVKAPTKKHWCMKIKQCHFVNSSACG